MATVLVIARPNLDRVWRLSAPLVVGGRNAYEHIEERYGGGGFYTGSALIALGHHVRLMATLADDAKGRAFRGDLHRAGFDVANVRMVPGQTIPVDVMIDPLGERTIFACASVEHASVADFPLDNVEAVYVNARRVEPRLMQSAMARGLVVAQAPLELEQLRPCHYLVASRSDLAPARTLAPLDQARAVAGDGLLAYIVTDGARPTHIYSAAGETIIPAQTLSRSADSVGAGDVFCAGLIDALIRGLSIDNAVAFGGAHAAGFLSNRENPFDVTVI